MPERFTKILVVYFINCRVFNILFSLFSCSKCTISVSRLSGNCFLFEFSLNCLQKFISSLKFLGLCSIVKKYLLYLGYDFRKGNKC